MQLAKQNTEPKIYLDSSGLLVFNVTGCLTAVGFLTLKNGKCVVINGKEISGVKRYSRNGVVKISQEIVDDHNTLLEAMQLFALDHCEIKRSVEPFQFVGGKLKTFLDTQVADSGTLSCVTQEQTESRKRYLFGRQSKTFAFFHEPNQTAVEVIRLA